MRASVSKIDLLKDIYFQKEYVSLYLGPGHEIFEFDYQSGSDRFYNLSVKRPIDRIGDVVVSDGYFDLESAYGYGGYYSTTENQVFLHKAFNAYYQQCKDERVIAEFIRFHPYNTFPSVSNFWLDFLTLDRKTISIDLTIKKEERWSKYSSTTRNILRKAAANLILRETDDIDGFMQMYQSTMEKNNASSFYYFPKEFYEKLKSMNNVRLFSVVYEDQIINMSFVLIGKDLAHYHLSTNSGSFAKLNGNYFLLDSVCDFLKQNYPGVSEFHLGGGRTSANDDTLLAFKSKFSCIQNSFHIAGKIFNDTVFQKYCEDFDKLYPELKNAKYFLKYRMDVT